MVRTAGRLSLDWYRNLDRVENKHAMAGRDGFDPVTEADRAVEAELRRLLAERFPGHSIMGEEYGLEGDGPLRWTIDPIDGTRAFITGQPMWGTILGFQIDGHPVAGWMYLPALDESFIGHGTSCRMMTSEQTRTLSVSGTEQLEDAIVLCTDPTMFPPGEPTERFQRVAERVKLVRYAGDCVNYGLLAMGLADLVIENGLAPYDIIPLIPIVEAAGGVVTDLDGNTPTEGGYVVAAGSEALHAAAIALLKP